MACDPTGRRGVCRAFVLRPIVLLALAYLSPPVTAQAQGIGCVLQTAGTPERQVLRCRDGLTVEAERGADYTLLQSSLSTGPDAVVLRSGAVLVDAPARSGRRPFQVRTPQAIAAVRGTRWAVDAGGGKTAVFVVEGRVSVRRANAARGVSLGPGEGVDVEPGTAPLTVRRWPAARASALLARFGR